MNMVKKNRNLLRSFCAIAAMLFTVSIASADTKTRTKTTASGQSFESTSYLKGSRQRTEQGGTGMSMINQCDLKRIIQLNDKAKTYMIVSTGRDSQKPAQTPNANDTSAQPNTQRPDGRKGGVVTYTTTLTDTGERKQIFGLTARHIKSSLTVESSPDACNPTKMKMETDAWYVDFSDGLNCQADGGYAPQFQGSKPNCEDEIRQKTIGNAKLGYPVWQQITMYGEDGTQSVMTIEVIELERTTLEASLFEIPPGYTEAKTFQEFVGAGLASALIDGSNSQSAGQGTHRSNEQASFVVGPKRPGVIRIGIASANDRTGRLASREYVRANLVNAINSSNIEAVPLNGRTNEQVEAEAKQSGCDFVLFTDVAGIKKSGSGGMLGKVSRAAGVNPVKEKFEVKVEYKLFTPGSSSPVLSSSATGKSGGGVDAGAAVNLGSQVASAATYGRGAGYYGYGFGRGYGFGAPGMGSYFWYHAGPSIAMNMMLMGVQASSENAAGYDHELSRGSGLGAEEESALSSAIKQEAAAVVASAQKGN